MTVKSKESGKELHRNTKHLKKLVTENKDEIPEQNGCPDEEGNSTSKPGNVSIENSESREEISSRPRRETKQPAYLEDYQIHNLNSF